MVEICCSAIESDACAELGAGKEALVEYLYLDLNTCERCIGTDLEDCRVWESEGQTYEVPPKEYLAEGILKAVFGQPEGPCDCGTYAMPENLEAFYRGKDRCDCSGSCDCKE